MQSNNHGGKRPGAGRKSAGRVTFNARLKPDVVEIIRAHTVRQRGPRGTFKRKSQADVIAEALDVFDTLTPRPVAV